MTTNVLNYAKEHNLKEILQQILDQIIPQFILESGKSLGHPDESCEKILQGHSMQEYFRRVKKIFNIKLLFKAYSNIGLFDKDACVLSLFHVQKKGVEVDFTPIGAHTNQLIQFFVFKFIKEI